jgi:hypothetical protein
MTNFNHGQLHHLSRAFDLTGQLELMNSKLTFSIGNFYNRQVYCYRIHLEEVFLCMLCKVATGMTHVQIVDSWR